MVLSLLIFFVDDLPFEGDSWSDTLLNWAAVGFLYFIYFSLSVMAISIAFWSITARGFWSWVVACFVALVMAMWLGRYWGYGICLGAMLALVTALKIYLGIGQRPEQVASWIHKLSGWWDKISNSEGRRYPKN